MRRREFLARFAALAAWIATGCARAPAPPPASTAAPTAPPEPSGAVLRLAAAGDTTLGYNLEAHFDAQLAVGVPIESLLPLYFAGVRPVLAAADLAVVNLECPFTARGTKLQKNFNFRARPERVKILEEGAVGAVSLGNNHLMDYGGEGVVDTVETLNAAGIGHFGAGRNLAEARVPLIVERGGVRLGVLGYYFQADPDMFEPRGIYATPLSAGVAGCYMDLDCIERQLREDIHAAVERVDALIPFFHWGHEGSTEVRPYQVELAHLAVNLGCRAVLGAHPHRLQGVEVHRGAPIFYSLGNFVYGGNKDPKDKLSAIARLTIPKRGPVEADLVPIQITRWPEAPFQPFLLEGDEKSAALTHIADLSRGFGATLPQLAAAAAPSPAPAAPAAPDSAARLWR